MMVIYRNTLSGDTVGFVLSNALNVSLKVGGGYWLNQGIILFCFGLVFCFFFV